MKKCHPTLLNYNLRLCFIEQKKKKYHILIDACQDSERIPPTHINMKMNQGDEFLRNYCVIIDCSVSRIFGALLQVSVTGAAVAAIIQVCSIKCVMPADCTNRRIKFS